MTSHLDAKEGALVNKLFVNASVALLLVGGLAAYSEVSLAGPESKPNPNDVCADKQTNKQAVKVGDTVVIGIPGENGPHWSTSSDRLVLSRNGNGDEVMLAVSTTLGGPSLPLGDCFRSGSYIRLVSTKHIDANRFLQAKISGNVDYVQIGNFPDPQLDSIFNVVKDPNAVDNSTGAIIRRNDVVLIRGVTHDPWLVAPANSAEGAVVGLQPDSALATGWRIAQKKPN